MTTDENEQNINELKLQRENQQLSIDEVCDKLKLTRDAINKLESSDFVNLGAYTYVRGYMQNYAQLLGLDIQKYIDLIPKENFESKIVNTYSKSEKLVKFKRQSKGFGNYAVGTFMFLAVSITGWFFLKQYTVSKTRTLDLNANTTLEIEKPDVLELPNKTLNEADSYHYSSLIPSDENSGSESNVTSDSVISNEAINTIEDTAGQMNKNISVGLDGLEESQNDASSFNRSPSLNGSEARSAEDKYNGYSIEVSALETSWVEIKKQNGEKIFSNMFSPGKKIFNSDEPIHFRIGNESKVNLVINGENIDLSKYSNKDIADFDWPLTES